MRLDRPLKQYQTKLPIGEEISGGYGSTDGFADDTYAVCQQRTTSLAAIKTSYKILL